jgi:hypothetical protein
MVHLELDEAVEADLASQARERGLSPEQLAIELVRVGLRDQTASETVREQRKTAIEAIIRDSKDRTLGLNGMSLREFAHLDHKY